MTVFAGVVVFDGATASLHLTKEQVSRALGVRPEGQVQVRAADGGVVAQHVVSPPRNASGSYRSADPDPIFIADARLDNRAELGRALDLAPADLARMSDPAVLQDMYWRWGEAGVARCLGAFAFAHWDVGRRRLILGRDCLGNRSLFFHHGNGFVAFASTLRILLALPCVPRELDELALADYLALDFSEARQTLYRGIERVPSRTMISIDAAGVRSRHYWSPDLDAPPPFKRDHDYVERARELFDQAVAAAIADTAHVAIATSGGLDSSAVAAAAARLGRAESISCYTLVPPDGFQLDLGRFGYLDERAKVEALARLHPQLKVRFLAPERAHPDVADETRYFARTAGPTFGPANQATFAHLYEAAAAAGHRVVLTGVAGNYGLSWNGRFSLLALLRRGQWATFGREFPAVARQTNRPLAQVFASDVIMPGSSPGLRSWIHRWRGREPDDVTSYSALNPAFVAEHDLPARWRQQGFDPGFVGNGWHPAQYRAGRLFDYGQLGRDSMAMSGEINNFELRDPHGDRRLLEFLLSVPEPMYRRNGVPRSFAREALADRLPREILTERRTGAQGVTWFRDLEAKRDGIASDIERLEASPIASRMIDLPRLKRLMHEWPASAQAAESRKREYRLALWRGINVGRFIRWVEGGNA
jgi:asparagine synthase (glutamine-hydrolysing)